MFSRRQKTVFVFLPCFISFLYLISLWSANPPTELLGDTIQKYIPHNDRINAKWPFSSSEDDHTESHKQLEEIANPWPPQGIQVTTHPVPGAYGFNIFDDIYLFNGTFFIVTLDSTEFPARDTIISRPVRRGGGTEDAEPTDEELQYITPQEAESLFSQTPIPIPGFSMVFYDTEQFMSHFYHWWGEIILGSWRVYSSLAAKIGIEVDELPLPDRFIVPFVENHKWRDPAGLDGPLMRACFPGAPVQEADYWRDLKKINAAVHFERVMLVNRVAAHRHPNGAKWFKMIASTMEINAPEEYFEPLRRRILLNMIGFVPTVDSDTGRVTYPESLVTDKPVVTYISRQGGHRKLADESEESLVGALKALEDEGVCELQMPLMETLTLAEQITLTARSTIVLGVHGNGLTHQLWMPPSPRSAVIEMMYPDSYVFDYEMLARNMGHKHFAISNNTFLTYPKGTYHKGINYGATENFHGDYIPVHGPAVAGLIRKRLTYPLDAFDEELADS